MTRCKEISFRCRCCKQQILKYYGGTATLSMKCTKCKRVLLPKRYEQSWIDKMEKNGNIFI